MNNCRIFCTVLMILLPTLLSYAQEINRNNTGLTPNIQEMTRQISKLRAEGKTAQEIYDYQQTLLAPSAGGSISGSVFQSDGLSPLPSDANIIAFDSYGYYISSAYISSGDTAYFIYNLPPGLYYVQAFPYGNFISEFYNDAIDWRQATLVRVILDSQTVGIDFKLDGGKVITGKILDENSLDPLLGFNTQFIVYDSNAKLESDTYLYYFGGTDQSGRYFIQGLAPGDYKLKVWVDTRKEEFYQNKTQLAEADILSIGAEMDTLKFINFLLGPIIAVQDGYEPNGTIPTAYPMMIGESVTPQINPAGDVDYFVVNGQAGDFVNLYIKANSIGSSLLPYLTIYDSTGINNLESWIDPDIKILNIPLPYTGQYFCQVRNIDPQSGGTNFHYTLMIEEATKPERGSISGNVYLDNEQTPYSGNGYQVYLYESETLNFLTSVYSPMPYYQFDDIPVGVYKIRIEPSSDPLYVWEWFDNARLPDAAVNISVTASDTIKNIDFVLDRGGSISGRIFLNDLSTDYTLGGTLYFYTGSTFDYINGYSVPPNEKGLYLIPRLQPGQYKVGFSADYQLNYEYPTVWYDQVGAPFQGTPVDITIGDTTDNINFILRKGGRIQGFVHLPDGSTPIGNDSMQVDLMLYDPLSGNVLGETIENMFSAGYRTPYLFPGSYKFQALSQVSSLANWYYEGGHQFDDINTMDIEIQSGKVLEVNITLDNGGASLSGVVYEEDGSTPTERPGHIYAYDASGHIVQSTVIGIDPATNQLLETGHYRLTGLKNGNYYLMLTFDIIQLKQQPNKNIAFKLGAIQRPMPGISKMRQIWYGEVVVETDNFRFLQFQNIPDGAITVSVNEPNDTPNINFSFLQSAIDFNDTKALPTEFGLESVFPNPFNPEATIRYAVPYASQITIEIFDILGRKVATVLDQKQSSGWHTVQWNGQNDQHEAVTSGIYIARLKAADQVSTRKMILLR